MSKKEDIVLRFGRVVRRYREELGISQEKFAHLCQMDRSYFGQVERGLRNVTLRTLEIIAGKLEVPLGELMEAVEKEPKPRKKRKAKKKS